MGLKTQFKYNLKLNKYKLSTSRGRGGHRPPIQLLAESPHQGDQNDPLSEAREAVVEEIKQKQKKVPKLGSGLGSKLLGAETVPDPTAWLRSRTA